MSSAPGTNQGAWIRVTPAEAQAAALQHFGLQASATLLAGELDWNFKMQDPSGTFYVLKFYRPMRGPAELRRQTEVLQALGQKELGFECPRDVPNLRGELLTALEGGGWLRMLTWLEGVQWVDVKPQGSELLQDLGVKLARLSLALEPLDLPAGSPLSDLPWNLLRALSTIEARRGSISDPRRSALLERWIERITPALGRAAELPLVLLHNDANDHNLLVSPARAGAPARRVSGLIDFGDLTHGPRVIELATAAAYACLHKRDPLGAMAQVAIGFQGEAPLSQEELELLAHLAIARLCLSVSMSADQLRERPENTYLAVSELPAWRALELLETHSDEFLVARLRHAAGLAPSRACDGLSERLAALECKRVLPEAFYTKVIELDLSIGSLDAPSPEQESEGIWQHQVRSQFTEHGASMLVGRYDEARLCYLGAEYALPGEERELRRCVHLGIDLFAPAGTEVLAPLEARVFSVHDNRGERNYGTTVILEHELDGQRVYSLYGHLGRAALGELQVGQILAAGERFAVLGAAEENGGWPPHLHLQWIADPLGEEHDYPGAAAPEERDFWLQLCPDPRRLAGLPPAAESAYDLQQLQRERAAHHGSNLSVSYRRPLHLVRGRGAQLFDAEGRAYLDAVNNVPQVGHCHPRVVRAAARQMALLNTNTRYLDRERQRYLQRLCALFPAPLEVAYLVCSGSEANELALRLARAHNARHGVAVLGAAYHGNTSSLVELSPYKFEGRGGAGRPEHVQVLPAPDAYRGRFRRDDPRRGEHYADLMLAALERGEAAGHPIGAFFAESLLGCAGQIPLPPGFLARAYEHVRAAGGLCIADEVQVGFGRVGEHFWGFEAQGVVPDIVTLGKPMGNGHPLAGVITTRAIASSFDSGMEYFNTFGGNQVSVAVGHSVLDVIAEEGLQENALRVGGMLRAGLEALAQKHAIIGDVRGAGLFLGLELVHDRKSLAPAPRVASYVAERMRERGILISTDGPLHNVLKIKPPLVFSQADAEHLLAQLAVVLGEDPAQPNGTRT